MNRRLLALLALLCFTLPAYAAEPLPGDACAAANNLQFTSGPEVAGGGGHAMLCQGGTWKSVLSFNSAAGLTKLGNQTCATNEILKCNGTTWACSADAAGSTVWLDGGAGKLYYNGGNVGLGTNNPQSTLDLGAGTNGRSLVWGGSAGTAHYSSIGTTYSSGDLVVAGGLKLDTAADVLQYSWTGSIGVSGVRFDTNPGDTFFLNQATAARTAGTTFDWANNISMTIKANGNVGIGKPPTSLLDVDGTVTGTLFSGSGASLTNLPAANLTGTLPAISGVNLTSLNASNLGSGTVPDARFPATLPAASGVNLTALNATNFASGTVAAARLPTFGTAAAGIVGASGGGTSNYLRADGTWAAPTAALPGLASTNIWVGSAGGLATAAAMSGDATLSNTGVLTLGASSVTTTEIADATVASIDIAADTIAAVDIAADALGASELAAASVAIANLTATGTASATTYLRGDNTWATPATSSDVHEMVLYEANATFTVPAGVGYVRATMIGGGGGGGSSGGSGFSCGGGAGAFIMKWVAVTPGAAMPVVVGQGGAGQTGVGAGSPGTDSTFGGLTAQNGSAAALCPAAGGTASGGTINFSGAAATASSGSGAVAAQWHPYQSYGNGGDGKSFSTNGTPGAGGMVLLEY